MGLSICNLVARLALDTQYRLSRWLEPDSSLCARGPWGRLLYHVRSFLFWVLIRNEPQFCPICKIYSGRSMRGRFCPICGFQFQESLGPHCELVASPIPRISKFLLARSHQGREEHFQFVQQFVVYLGKKENRIWALLDEPLPQDCISPISFIFANQGKVVRFQVTEWTCVPSPVPHGRPRWLLSMRKSYELRGVCPTPEFAVLRHTPTSPPEAFSHMAGKTFIGKIVALVQFGGLAWITLQDRLGNLHRIHCEDFERIRSSLLNLYQMIGEDLWNQEIACTTNYRGLLSHIGLPPKE